MSRPRQSLLSLFDPLSDDDNDKENTNAGEASFFQRQLKSPEAIKPAFKSRLIDIGDMSMHEPDSNILTDEEELENELATNTRYDDENDTLTFTEMVKAATPKWSAKKANTLSTPRSSPSFRLPLGEIRLTEEATPVTRKRPTIRQFGTPTSKLSQVELPISPQGSSHFTDMPSTPTAFSTPPPAIIISPEEPSHYEPMPRNMLGSSVCTLDLPVTSEALLTDTPILCTPPSPHLYANDSLPLPSPSEHRLRPKLLTPVSQQNNRISVDLHASFNLQLNSSESSFDLLNDKISFLSANDGLDSFLNNLEDDPSFGENDFKSLDLSSSKLKHFPEGRSKLKRPKSFAPLDSIDRATSESSPSEKDHRRFSSSSNLELKLDHRRKSSSDDAFPEGDDNEEVCAHEPVASEMTTTGLGSTVLSTPSPSRAIQPPPRPIPALRIVKRSKAAVLDSLKRSSLSTAGFVGNKLAPNTTSRGIPRLSPPQSPCAVEDSTKGVQRGKAAVSSSTMTAGGPRRVMVKEESKVDTGRATRPSMSTGGPRRVIVSTTSSDTSDKPSLPRTNAQGISSGLRQPVKYGTVGSGSAIPKPVARPVASKLPAPAATRRFGLPSSLGLGTRGTTNTKT